LIFIAGVTTKPLFLYTEDIGRNFLVDTYWSGGNRRFTEAKIKEEMELTFVANLNDLKQVNHKDDFNNYDDADCIDISHPNDLNGGFYIKKTAKPSIKKKQKVLIAHIKHAKSKIEFYQHQIDRCNKSLNNLKEKNK